MRKVHALLALALFLSLTGCGEGGGGLTIDQIRSKLDKIPEYSVILADMDSRGLFAQDYFHRYQIVTLERKKDQPDAEPVAKQNATNWVRVDKETYDKYAPSLGMAILSKRQDGTIDTVPKPPAYQFVGDSRFGRWEKDNSGEQVWQWIAASMVLANVMDQIGGGSRYQGRPPVQYRDYEDYRSSSRQGLPYFGRRDNQGRTEYGTQGTVTQKSSPGFFERQQARMAERKESFAGKVESRMGRSAAPSSRSSGGGFGTGSRGRR